MRGLAWDEHVVPLMVRAPFDEAKHPRDPRGRWAHSLTHLRSTAAARAALGAEMDAQGLPPDSPLRGVLQYDVRGTHKLVHRDEAGRIDAGIDYRYQKRLRTQSHHIEINNMRVLPKRQGIGSAMIADLARQYPDAKEMAVYGAVENAKPFYAMTGAKFVPWSHMGEWDAAAVDRLRRTQASRAAFDEAKHPRVPRGHHGGGEFAHIAGELAEHPPRQPAEAIDTGRNTFAGADKKLAAAVDKKLAAPQMLRAGGLGRPGLPPYRESVQRVRDAILREIATQPGALEMGKAWYPNERKHAERRAKAYGVSPAQAAGVMAATSPRASYDINQRVTDEILDAVPRLREAAEPVAEAGGGVMGTFRDEGVRIALGESPDTALGGLKQRSFFNNMMWPGQTDDVTVDTWMMDTMAQGLGMTHDQAAHLGREKVGGSPLGYLLAADATRDAAKRLGIAPDQAQAAYWIARQQALGIVNPSAQQGRTKRGSAGRLRARGEVGAA